MFANPSPNLFDRSPRASLDWRTSLKSLNVIRQLTRRCVAVLWLLSQAFEANCFEIARHIRLQLSYRHRFAMQHLQDRVQQRFSLEWRTASQQFVKDGSQRV